MLQTEVKHYIRPWKLEKLIHLCEYIEKMGEREREREERESVCVCVCVCVRRGERLNTGTFTFHLKKKRR